MTPDLVFYLLHYLVARIRGTNYRNKEEITFGIYSWERVHDLGSNREGRTRENEQFWLYKIQKFLYKQIECSKNRKGSRYLRKNIFAASFSDKDLLFKRYKETNSDLYATVKAYV